MNLDPGLILIDLFLCAYHFVFPGQLTRFDDLMNKKTDVYNREVECLLLRASIVLVARSVEITQVQSWPWILILRLETFQYNSRRKIFGGLCTSVLIYKVQIGIKSRLAVYFDQFIIIFARKMSFKCVSLA